MNNRGQIVFVPKRSSVSLQMLLKCLATMFAAPVLAENLADRVGKAGAAVGQHVPLLPAHRAAQRPLLREEPGERGPHPHGGQ